MTFQRWTSLTLLGGLMGCSSLVPAPSDGPVLMSRLPATRVQAPGLLSPGASVIDQVYGLGREAHANGHLKIAGQRYERVLAMQPDHVGALNALGVIRAEDGQTVEALDLFMRARELAPDTAHIHNNIGYTLLHAGRLDEAESALERARVLAPDSAQTRRNQERLAQARARQHPPPALGMASPPALSGVQPVTSTDAPVLVSVAPNVFELRVPSTPAAPVESPAALTAGQASGEAPHQPDASPTGQALPQLAGQWIGQGSVQWTDVPGVKLEVSNGVGIARLARRTALRLAEMGMAATRLTNAASYRQMHTQIEYLPGQQEAARALADRLPVLVDQVQVPAFTAPVHLRLVLGHDLAGRGIAAWSQGTWPASASASVKEGGREAPLRSPAVANSGNS